MTQGEYGQTTVVTSVLELMIGCGGCWKAAFRSMESIWAWWPRLCMRWIAAAV